MRAREAAARRQRRRGGADLEDFAASDHRAQVSRLMPGTLSLRPSFCDAR